MGNQIDNAESEWLIGLVDEHWSIIQQLSLPVISEFALLGAIVGRRVIQSAHVQMVELYGDDRSRLNVPFWNESVAMMTADECQVFFKNQNHLYRWRSFKIKRCFGTGTNFGTY